MWRFLRRDFTALELLGTAVRAGVVEVGAAGGGGVTFLGGGREGVAAVDSFIRLPLHRPIL